MNESRQTSILEIILVLLFVFSLFIYFIFKEGTDSSSVEAENRGDTNATTTLSASDAIYDQFIKRIYEEGGSGTTNVESEFKSAVNQKVSLPGITLGPINYGDFDEKKYNQQFESLWENSKRLGMASETDIFVAQIYNTDLFIPLSQYDKETILRSANLYEELAQNIEKLDTPTKFKVKAEESIKSSMYVAYILKKMIVEDDENLYKLWLTKYIEEVSVILSARYVTN